MAILALDTATLTASAAVVGADGTLLAAAAGDPAEHSDRVLALCAAVLEAAGLAAKDLDAIACGAGPGSFTGLRIGVATGKGLAYALGKPLWLASSLAAMAWGLVDAVADGALVVPVLDARRGEIYAGFYRRHGAGLVAAGPERVFPPGELVAAIAAHDGAAGGAGAVHLCGDALTVHAAVLADLPAEFTRHPGPVTPPAHGVGRAALAGDRLDQLSAGTPAYIRPSEAEVKYPHGVPVRR